MDGQGPDYYRILGVAPDAPAEEIRRAWRRLARRWHPDRNTSPEAEARFKAVNEAWAVLGDAERRRAYDRERRRRPSGGDAAAAGSPEPPPSPGDVSRSPGGKRRLRDRLLGLFSFGAREETAVVRLTLEEAHRGGEQTLRVRGRRLRVRLPAGITDGRRIRLRGQARGGGDLLLAVRLKPHPRFRVEGADLLLELPVAPWEAVHGARIGAPTLDGPVRLEIPPGSQSGRRLRLRGKGLGGRGDLLVRVMIRMPPPDAPGVREACALLKATGFDPRAGSE